MNPCLGILSLKRTLRDLIAAALARLRDASQLDVELPEITIERTRDRRHGDFACNVALALAKQARRPPRELAIEIIGALPACDALRRVEVAGPGFINFFLAPVVLQHVIKTILQQGDAYGRSEIGKGKRVLVEFVSANPTGPLHIGHGRGAAYGAALASLLEETGFRVHREYYVNDAGRQIDILTVSLWLRYLENCGETVAFPENGYRGGYVVAIAAALRRERGDAFRMAANQLIDGISPDTPSEAHLDALIERARALLGDQRYAEVREYGLNQILAGIRDDLTAFGVRYEEWFSERSLIDEPAVERSLARLESQGRVYARDGARWFNSSAFGDEKDRVVVRENGEPTYFASDIAYHMNKLERGFDKLLNIWGADHHGYVARVKSALVAMGEDPERLEVLLVQFASLYRGSEKLQMSTRSGEFITLRELVEEVGRDAARFFYVTRRSEQHLDFDLELAKSASADNPVYYVQYAHARVCSVLHQLEEKGYSWDPGLGNDKLDLLTEAHEQALIAALARYPECVESAAVSREPHQIANYLRELANDFHTYYNAHQFIVPSAALRNARLNLVVAARQTIRNGLRLLGVSAPEMM